MEKISIIIPVYKVEQYLEKCIDSVCSQSYRNLEIILVEDGSPDRCYEMCDLYAKMDYRIKVIHKENQGLSEARNDGLKMASGDYIAFVDSDDWIDNDMLETMLNACRQYGADIAVCAPRWIFGKQKIEKGEGKIYCCEGRIALIHHILCEYNFSNSAWGKLYKKEIVKDLRFPAGVFYEDFIFTVNALYRSKKCVDIDLSKYNYVYRNDSIMGLGIVEKHIFDLPDLYDKELEFYRQNGLMEEYDLCSQRFFSEMLIYRMKVKQAGNLDKKENYLKIIDEKIKEYARYLVKIKLRCRTKVLYIAYRIHPALSYFILSTYAKLRKPDHKW